MHRSPSANDGFEINVVGPLPLRSGEPRALLWLLKAGQMVLGSVRLGCEHPQVAVVRDLQLHSEASRSRQAYSAKLISAVAEYAREHGILKLKVHRNSRCEWLPQQLSMLGFSDAARSGDDMQFYLDLYKPLKRRHRAYPSHADAPFQLAC